MCTPEVEKSSPFMPIWVLSGCRWSSTLRDGGCRRLGRALLGAASRSAHTGIHDVVLYVPEVTAASEKLDAFCDMPLRLE